MIVDEASARAFVSRNASEEAMERLSILCAALIAENKQQNLISKPSENQIWQRHIADSVQLLGHVPRGTMDAATAKWLDLGSGAGFPGLVIAAIHPELEVVLVESRKRRVEWLQRMADELNLPKCQVRGKRLEVVTPFPAIVITARAFAPLKKLLRLSSPFSTSATTYLLPKGRSAQQELDELPESQKKLFHVEQSLTDKDAGIIVSNASEVHL